MIKLQAEKGYVLCDGETYGTEIVFPENADTSNWTQMTEEEAIKLISRNQTLEERVTELEECMNVLLGVEVNE